MSERANLLYLHSDQHSPFVAGCYGDALVHTPNLDRLAARGVVLDGCYCPSPLCVPSRMSALTGRHPFENGVWTNSHILDSAIPTLVLYTSDHGELAGEHGLWWKQTCSTPSTARPCPTPGAAACCRCSRRRDRSSGRTWPSASSASTRPDRADPLPHYATKELSQDAFICWLVACASQATGDLQKCGLAFVRTLFRAGASSGRASVPVLGPDGKRTAPYVGLA